MLASHNFFSLHPPYILWLPWVLELLPVIKGIKINDHAGRSRELEARAQQLSNVWSQKRPKQHYGVCNELDLLLELEVAPSQQLGTVAGTCGREQSTAAREGGS